MNTHFHFFLRYGYFPDYSPLVQTPLPKQLDFGHQTYSQLVASFAKRFDQVIQEMLSRSGNNIVIPISGGLDSRAILAGVLKHLSPKEIRTYTFGLPGSYDYEIGKLVAKTAEVAHTPVDLNAVPLDIEQMWEVAGRCDYQTHLFHHPPIHQLDKIVEDSTILSGYMGDVVFGSYADKHNIAQENAAKWYLDHKNYTAHLALSAKSSSDCDRLQKQLNLSLPMSSAEQLIIYERGPKLMAPHIL